MATKWHDFERYRAVEKLINDFPELSASKLFAAIRACEHEVKRYEGLDKLVESTKDFIRRSSLGSRGSGL